MKVSQGQGLSIYALSGIFSSLFNPPEDSLYFEFCIGLIKNDLSIISTNTEEPKANSYKRAKTNGSEWTIELKQVERSLVLCATNSRPILFPEISGVWGLIKSVAVFKDTETNQFTAFSHLPEHIDMGSAPSSQTGSPVFNAGKLIFAMSLLEETEDDENVISTILKGEKSIMIGKVQEYEGCPLEKPETCTEHLSELRCGIKRTDKICKKVARLKGTTSPAMTSGVGRRKLKR